MPLDSDRLSGQAIGEVRDDFVPATDFYLQDFAELENERLWPRVWQLACREEDIPKVGDFYTYDIVDDSIAVVRTGPDEVRAFHNACPHRGRRLTKGCGHMTRFHCRFHGWQFGLDGKPLHVVDRSDWGDLLRDEDISLIEVKVGRWGGWIYVNMDPDCESLESFLGEAKTAHDPLEQAGLRYYWVKSALVPCNWKTILGLFNESYHLQQTHKQMLRYWDDYTHSYARGMHGMFLQKDTRPPGMPSARLGDVREDIDIRAGIADYIKDMTVTLDATDALVMVEAAQRLVTEVPREADPMEVLGKLAQFTIESQAAKGVATPILTIEQMVDLGQDWHVFPNHIMISGPNGCLAYRARPNGHDPDSAIWDVFSLLRFPDGQEPKITWQRNDDLTDESFWPLILRQDFENLGEIQQGLKSRGFRGARPNPVQEVPVSNFHRSLRKFMGV